MAVRHHRRLADIEWAERSDELERIFDVAMIAGRWHLAAEHALGHEQFGRDIFDADHTQPAAFSDACDP